MHIAGRRTAVIAIGLAATLSLVATVLGAGGEVTANIGDGSGGKAIAHEPGARRVKAGNAPDAKLFRIEVDGAVLKSGEPTLGLTKSGDLFYAAIQSNTRVEVAHTGNNGKTWDLRSPKIGTRNAHLLTLDPYVYVDKYTDRIFTIDLTVACSYLSFSDDKGKSWITNPLACGRPVNDHQTLFSGPARQSPTPLYKNIVYYCWNDVGTSSCTKSLDGGLTFHPTGSPAFTGADPGAGGQGIPFCGGLHGHGFVGPDGTVLLPKGHCGQPWLAISKDEGRTWDRVQVAKNGSADHEASVAMDKKGNIYYVYISDDRLPYLVVSENGGKKWSKPMMIAPPGVEEANIPSLDVGDVGKVAFTYMGSENSPFEPGKDRPPASAYSKTTWNGYMAMTANALAKKPTFYTATVNDERDPLLRGTCGPGRCQTIVYDFIDVVVGPDGTPWAAFTDGCTLTCTDRGATTNSGAEAVVGRLVGGPSLR